MLCVCFRTLHERCQNLMRKYDKESRANKRLSMEYEELMWKLSESFQESDLGAQEALFYQKLGMSPTSPGGELTSPLFARKLQTPSSSESSPSKSPGYRRTLSSSAEEREEKKLKRRSGNYLLDERKLQQPRATSPLAKNNPLIRSWSPGLQASSPPRTYSKAGNKMSQSWCVDMDIKDSIVEQDSIPRSASSSGKPRIPKLVTKEVVDSGDNSDSDKGFVSTNNSCNSTSQGFSDSGDLSESLKSNGGSDISDCVPISSTPRSGRETVTLTTSDNVFNEEEIDSNKQSPDGSVTDSDSSQQVDDHNVSDSKIKSTSTQGTASSPSSKLPLPTDFKDSSPTKSHTETTV